MNRSDKFETLLFELCEDDNSIMNIITAAGSVITTTCDKISVNKNQKTINQLDDDYYEAKICKFNDDLFKEHFHMSREIFQKLLQTIGNHLEDNVVPIGNVKLEKKLLLTLWMLTKSESFHRVGNRFSLAKSSTHKIFQYIINTLADLMPNYIQWPDANKISATSKIFQEKSGGIPNIIGILDACHIRIKQPVGGGTEFLNDNTNHSIILQGVCDENYRFIDVFIGMPGKLSETQVFCKSDLFKHLISSKKDMTEEQHLIANGLYPLAMYLMTPYENDGNLQLMQNNFNNSLRTIRSTIDKTFALLKANFNRLCFLDIEGPTMGNLIIAAACMLHNFIIDNSDSDDDIDFDNIIIQQKNDNEYYRFEQSAQAIQKRDNIAYNLFS